MCCCARRDQADMRHARGEGDRSPLCSRRWLACACCLWCGEDALCSAQPVPAPLVITWPAGKPLRMSKKQGERQPARVEVSGQSRKGHARKSESRRSSPVHTHGIVNVDVQT